MKRADDVTETKDTSSWGSGQAAPRRHAALRVLPEYYVSSTTIIRAAFAREVFAWPAA